MVPGDDAERRLKASEVVQSPLEARTRACAAMHGGSMHRSAARNSRTSAPCGPSRVARLARAHTMPTEAPGPSFGLHFEPPARRWTDARNSARSAGFHTLPAQRVPTWPVLVAPKVPDLHHARARQQAAVVVRHRLPQVPPRLVEQPHLRGLQVQVA